MYYGVFTFGVFMIVCCELSSCIIDYCMYYLRLLCIADNLNEIYVIVMYKLSVGHTKIFCDFFLQRPIFDKIGSNFLLNWPFIDCRIFEKFGRIIE
jgi:hypothetical protein